MSTEQRVALSCAAVALAVSCVAVLATLSAHDGELTGLVRMAADEPIASLAREADPGFSFVDIGAHYDGVYFYAIARDPIARGDAHTLIDRAAYRYGHAGYGWLAWLVSGGGRASAVPAALLIVGLTGVAVASYASSLLAREMGWPGWGGLVVAFSPGAIFALTADTSEPVALAAVACALLAWRRRRLLPAAAALTAACLIKEPLLLVPAGLLAWEAVRWLRGVRIPRVRAKLLALSVGPVAFGAWYLYLRSAFGVWPLEQEAGDFLTVPFTGWADSLKKAAGMATGAFESSQIGSASLALLIVVGAALLVGMVRAARLRSPLDTVFLLYALLIFSLNWLGILYPKDLVREAALPLALLPAVLARPRAERDEAGLERPGQG
jgi:hypothetical protein